MRKTIPVEYVMGGRTVTEEQLLACKAKPKPKPRGPASKRVDNVHDATRSAGFTVSGFSPEHLVKAEKQRGEDIAFAKAWNAEHKECAMRVPPPWDAELYIRTARPIRARSRPYEIESAADQCAEMLRKAGWLGVRVEQDMSRRDDDVANPFMQSAA